MTRLDLIEQFENETEFPGTWNSGGMGGYTQEYVEWVEKKIIDISNLINKSSNTDSGSVLKCSNCKSSDVKIEFMPKRTNISWNNSDSIKNIKKFVRDDTYYYSDMIIEECSIHKCKNCGFKEAVSNTKNKLN